MNATLATANARAPLGGAATLEKIAALAPGAADAFIHWSTHASDWITRLLRPNYKAGHQE